MKYSDLYAGMKVGKGLLSLLSPSHRNIQGKQDWAEK